MPISSVIHNYLQSLNKKRPLTNFKKCRYSSPKKQKRIFYLNSKKASICRRNLPPSKEKIRQIIPKPLPFFSSESQNVQSLSLNANDVSSITQSSSHLDSEIKGTVVDKFLKDSSKDQIYSSSDTVNELLKGFSDPGVESFEEASTILPSFTNAYKSFCPMENKSSSRSDKEKEPFVFDESSSDYISRFKEIASNIEKQHSD